MTSAGYDRRSAVTAARSPAAEPRRQTVRLFLCGDVMTGRGIDQVLPHPCDPVLHESYAESAIDYVRLAEAANGPIPRGVDPSYPWGAALNEFDRMQPDARIINLETSITRSEDFAPKGINYRMSPENAAFLKAAAIDCCVLGNNHILDWGVRGLLDTLAALRQLQIKAAGAGQNLSEAGAPAVLDIAGRGRVLLFSFVDATSGAPPSWGATNERPGINLLSEISERSARGVADLVAQARRPGDLVIVSVHWGPNWGYHIPREQRRFAHAVIDQANVSIVHGHSSHHPKAIEVYRDRLILYGCGDFLNDYEGIKGYEKYRGDLVLMNFADVEPAGMLVALEIVPLQIRNFHLVPPSNEDVLWVQRTLDRESRKLGAAVALKADERLTVSWQPAAQDSA
jgi:poly-gamma-glutamate capsule biosynthesis protein CapA/YwtB (metallophosphatase superfamily)